MIERIGNEVSIERIQQAVEDGEKERRTLDWKRELNLTKPASRAEFASDAASFANSAGGVLVFGVAERIEQGRKTGEAGEIAGCPGFDDQAQSQMENILRELVKPRLPAYEIAAVPGGEEGPVVLVRILRSWAGPHMVRSRFYGRSSNGKYPLEVDEVRRAFLMLEGRMSDIASLRDERIGQIIGQATTYALSGEAIVATHLLPLSRTVVDTSAQVFHWPPTPVPLLGVGPTAVTEVRPNVEGVVVARASKTVPSYAFTQVFRTGGVELASSRIWPRDAEHPKRSTISLEQIQDQLTTAYAQVLAQPDLYGITFPVAVSLALHGYKGCVSDQVDFDDLDDFSDRRWRLDRDTVVIGPLVVNQPGSATDLLDPVMDELWAAFGLHRST